MATLTAKGVTVTFLTEKLSFTNSAVDPLSVLQLQLMGAFAEFERAIIRKRQAEGIAKAKAKAQGVYKGRPATINKLKVLSLHKAGVKPSEISRQLSISRASVYRALEIGRTVPEGLSC